ANRLLVLVLLRASDHEHWQCPIDYGHHSRSRLGTRGSAQQPLAVSVLPNPGTQIALNESVGVSTDQDSIGLRQALNAGSFIRDFTQCQVLISSLPAHFPHNDKPSMDA